MGKPIVTLVLSARRDEDVRTAGRLLREGQIVAFPTETVYGLGARGDDPEAVEALYALKRRPPQKKMTILIADPDQCDLYAAPLSRTAAALARELWPGPLTIVVPDLAGGEVGLRCPDCDATRAMLRAAHVPVVAPSANLSGEPAALSANDVLAAFDGKIAAVLDGGTVRLGLPSTVVRVKGETVQMLRVGALDKGRIRKVLARP